MKRPLLLLCLLLIPFLSPAQTVFWTENFNNGCSSGCTAVGYNGGNGLWTQTILGAEGADPNLWYVSCAENGHTPTVCGSACQPASATATLATLHVGSNPNSLGDAGAAYDAGGLCGILTCPQTNRRIESPTINCAGQNTITLNFNYIENGDPPNDDASVWYFDGATWSMLSNTAQTPTNCAGGQGRWTAFSMALPASANNNPNVKIGFLWINNDDGVGTDPSFAVDEITLTVPSVASPPVAAFTASATSVCTGQPVNFTDNSTNTPTSWSWTFPGGTPASATTQNVTGVVWAAAGTYTVTLTATNGSGSNSTTQVITVTAGPTVTAVATQQVICTGGTTTITGTGAAGYVWLPGGQTTPSITVSPATTTTYTVTGTTGVCSDTAQITITVQTCATPNAAFTASATTVCVGAPVNFTDNSTGGPTSWSWTFPSGTPGSATTQNVTGVTWSAAGTYTVTLTASNTNGSNSTTQVITVVASPTVTASASNTSVCSGSSVTLNAVGGGTYLWAPGGQTTATITVTPTTTTTYTVTGTNAQSCSDTGMVTVTVFPLPIINATTLNGTICPGDPAVLTAGGATSFTWNPGGLTGTSVTVTPATTTTYTVTGVDANNCSGTAQVTVIVQNCVVPVAAATASGSSGCLGDCFSFTDNSTGGPTSWQWQFPGASPATSSSQNPTNICYGTPGTYNVILIVTNAYGSDTITLANAVTISSPSPIVAGTDQTVAIGNTVTLTVTGGAPGSTYVWTPTTGLGCPTCQSPDATPLVTTTYTVVVTEPNGCTSTDTVRLDVVEAYGLFVPGAFSPNEDGHNDILYVRGAGVKELHFIVYSRIGEKIFESTSLQDGWDGTFRGQPMNTGVFVYYVSANFYNGESKVLKGDVTLVR